MSDFINIITKLVVEKPYHVEKILKRTYPDVLKFVLDNKGITVGEKIYNILHPNYNSLCPVCGNQCKFLTYNKGYSHHCSTKCSNSSKDIINKKSKSCFKSYGVYNPSQSDEIKKKKMATNIENFGVKCNLSLDSCKEQIKQTNLENSMGQMEIYNYIKDSFPDILLGDRKILSGKELDIYIPSKNIAIEYNGNYYHSEVGGGINKKYHLEKTLLCQSKGIRLIHIFEDEWLNKQDIMKSKLDSILGRNTVKIFARKCEIRTVENKECSDFLVKYHIQGRDNSKIKIGLYYNNSLVSVMTFGALRKALGSTAEEGVFELLRFCSSNPVVGGASKLLAHFIKNHNPTKIITYADRRWSVGGLYETLGFQFVHHSQPNYFYMKDHTKRYHRFGFRKSELSKKLATFNPDISEWENMKINGYDRIWDCGNSKYEWTANPDILNPI